MSRDSPYRRALHALTGQVRAPSLQTGEERTASRLELFFDLAFVLVVAELAAGLRGDVTAHGVVTFAGLFTAVWWAWVSSTLYANRFDHDDVVYRLYKLASMLAVIGLAATATEATGRRAVLFGGANLVLRVLLLSQYARAYRHVEAARLGVRIYLLTTAAGAALWTVSLLASGPARYALWAAAVLVEALAPLLATASSEDLPLHLEHLPERFALFVILVLGESVAAVAHGVHDAQWTAESVSVGVVSFVLAAGLWWSYFELAGAAAKRMLNRTGGERSVTAHDVYVFGQLPLCCSLAVVGVGIQLAVLQSGQGSLPPGTRLLLAGGVALYLTAVSATNTGMAGRLRTGWWWPLAAAAVAALDAAVRLPSVVVVGGLAALLVTVVAVGTAQRSRGTLQVDPL